MVIELNALIQSFRVVTDWVKANKSLRNFNEIVTAVSEANTKLMEVQTAALVAQEQQATLSQRIRDLEQEIVELKDWNREAERYQLTPVAIGVFAYHLKPGMEAGEPSHFLCTNCFAKREKSILQSDPPGPEVYTYRCLRCKSDLRVAIVPPVAGVSIPKVREY